MVKNLVIVESPAKAKTIEKFLGKDFKVASSFGHIADLPPKEFGVDVADNFKPTYIVSADKKPIVNELKKAVAQAQTVWLASDEDREGEAIAWHLAETLKLDKTKTRRIVFNSITKNAIQNAIANPRDIDYNLVNAQQARRVLDRLVGYELSPVLWKKVKRGLSAGRVQSVAVRLIVEREREIQQFKPEAAYKITAEFSTSEKKIVKAKLAKSFATKEEARRFLEKNIKAIFRVADLEMKPVKKSPAPPFTTSTLQQEASRKLYFPVAKTMNVAQRLYEAGHITYMRTDSTQLSREAIQAAQAEIEKSYGKPYSKPRNFAASSKTAQEAHEAIRPTDMGIHSLTLDSDQARLYELIWKRTLASQMSDALLERTLVKIEANTHKEHFTASGSVLKFDGFLKVYLESTDEEDEEREEILPALTVGEQLTARSITATERFTRPSFRYSEASLVKMLEELGIGRPSTYAPTISTIQQRGYVTRGAIEGVQRPYHQLALSGDTIYETLLSETVGADKGKLLPTDVGMIVNDFLVNHFASILDYHFTAKVEEDFDNIAKGEQDWTQMMKEFYKDFHPQVQQVEKHAERETGQRILGTDPTSGRQVSVKLGKYGPMIQIGMADEAEKPLFASLLREQTMESITLEEALALFQLPKNLGNYEGEEVELNVGRFGPYIHFGKTFISLPKGEDIMAVTLERATELIKIREKADAPIANYQGKPVTKGKGRFGPFIKWNELYVNVSKKYNFDRLSEQDIATLIEDKLKKDANKLIQEWKDEGIRIERARWGRAIIIKDKTKIELSRDTDASALTLPEVKALLEKSTPKKSARSKK